MANLIYQNDAAALTGQDSGGSYAMTLNNLAAGAGRQGAVHDFDVAARAARFAWRAWFQAATTPVVGEAVEVYLKTSDGTVPDNDDGTGDIAVSAENKLRNLLLIGRIEVDEAAIGVKFARSGEVWLPQRYVMPVFWNATADNLVATNNLSGFTLTPVPLEIQ